MPKEKLFSISIHDCRVDTYQGMSNKEISKIFGVHRRTINDITKGATWIHIKEKINE